MPPLSYTGNEILLQTHFLRLMPHSSDFHWGVLGHVSRCTASETDDDQMEEATTDAMPDAILRGSGLLSSNSGLIQTQQREISRPPSPPPSCASCERMDWSRGEPSCCEAVYHVRSIPYTDTTREASRRSLPPPFLPWHNPQTPPASSAPPGRHEHRCALEMRYGSDRIV